MSHKPVFVLKADNLNITQTVAQRLISLDLTDYGNATGKSDELRITLASETMDLPAKGVRLSLLLGFGDNLVDKGTFTVSGVASSGPPRQIEIYATAAPMNGQRHDGNVRNKKTRSFSGKTLGDIVKTVAADNGPTAKMQESLARIAVAHTDQSRESDAAFMTRLASQYNAVSKPSHGYWLFAVRGEGKSAGGKMLPLTVIPLSEVSDWSYSEGGQSDSAGSAKKGTKAVNYWDSAQGEVRKVELEYDGDDDEHAFVYPDEDSARQKASTLLTTSKQNEREMSLTVPCLPRHVSISAEQRIETRGFGRREDLNWMVESIRFSLSPSGLTAQVSLKTDISPPGKKGADKKGSGMDYGIGKPG